eukprot:763159-Hanusia_phi.AAC.1
MGCLFVLKRGSLIAVDFDKEKLARVFLVLLGLLGRWEGGGVKGESEWRRKGRKWNEGCLNKIILSARLALDSDVNS